MGIETICDLLQALLRVTAPEQVQDILTAVGDNPAVTIDEPFGPFGFQWHFYGDNASNMSTINLGSKPGRSLTERVTNAIDAVLEREVYQQGANAQLPDSPLDAVNQWFERPPTSANDGLFNMTADQLNDLSRQVHVVLLPGTEEARPTVDVIDSGIGLVPDEFGDTIMSFHRGNKISKRYLAGAFGQGGSATIAFSDYTLILSRHIDTGAVTGFTIVKLMELEESYKENAYVFLAVQNADGSVTVPNCPITEALDLYPGFPNSSKKPPDFRHGTVVRHYGYQLADLERSLMPTPRNLYHLFNTMLFDPLLPFRVVDLRQQGKYRNELVAGSRNRLMSGSRVAEVRHHQPRFWIRPSSGEEQTLGVEYWVVFSSLKVNGTKASERVRPNDLFVDPAHPIVGTLNGQNHGELTTRLLREAKLPQVAKHIIVHLDMTRLSKKMRSQIVSSTREGFKDGAVLNEVTRILKDHLRDDEYLHAIEAELEEALVQTGEDETDSEVKKEITRHLQQVGLDFTGSGVLKIGQVRADDAIPAGPRARSGKRTDALPTLPYPQNNRFEIVSPSEVLRIHHNDSRFIKIETDADALFDEYGAIKIRVVPNHLVDISKGTLIGGRLNWRLRPRRDSKPGDVGQIIVTLTLPSGQQKTRRLPYEILPPREEKIRTIRGLLPNFSMQGVDPYENPEQFYRVWDYLDPQVDNISSVAYRVVETRTGLVVYYSKAFTTYRKWLDEIMLKQPSMAQRFNQNYEIWIGYYALLQWQQRATNDQLANIQIDEEVLARMHDNEGALVAEIQVKQAVEIADLQRKFARLQ